MEVFSLSGPSGTGKSTSALAFAHKHKIPAIIDDGLLIFNGKKIAGTSAKFEKNPFTAVKRATFFDEDHLKEVQMAINNYYIDRILIIGTSDKMTRLIAERLNLGEIKHYYHVEDIRSPSEIKLAQFIRRTEGKHIIPIPYKQVDQSFFKKLIQKGMEIFSPKKERIGENTIVHPDFHRGTINIHKRAFKNIVEIVCSQYEAIDDCKAVEFHLEGLPILQATVTIRFPIRDSLKETMEKLQKDLHAHFMRMLNIELYSVDLTVQLAKKMESPAKR
jgi:ABC-type dipeptide/oligopeptide/nickel transport system ATPase component